MLVKIKPSTMVVFKENRLAESLSSSLAGSHAHYDNVDAALHALAEREVALLLIEMNVEGNILTLIRRALEIDSNTQILLFANEAELPLAVQGLEAGAVLIMPRPCDDQHLRSTLDYMSVHWKHLRQLYQYHQPPEAELLGSSPLTVNLRERVLKLSGHDATVLISGECGSGKTRLASFIHANSRRAQENFITLNCASLSPAEIEIALFGVEETGKIGALGAASAGTLYIHDVERLPGRAQEQLLRAIKEKDFFSGGGKRLWRSDVRILSSTSAPLRELAQRNKFREDFYWELCGVVLEVPALRERSADIEELLAVFLKNASHKLSKKTPAISSFLMEKIRKHLFPGNVAELKSLAGLMAALSEDGEVTMASLPAQLLAPVPTGKAPQMGSLALKPVAREFEKQYLLRVLKAVNGNQSKAARALDIHRNTLILKMQELGIPNKREVKGK